MKKYLILILSFCISCNHKEADKKAINKKEIYQTNTNNKLKKNEDNKINTSKNTQSELLFNINEFRNSVYKSDKEKVKSYIDFPILDNSSKERVSISYEEKDYIEKYDEIFSEKFIKVILEINFEKLLKNKEIETIKINYKDEYFYYCKATINEHYKILELYIPTYKKIYNDNGSIKEEIFFCSVAYKFDIKNNNITLSHIEYVG